MYDQDIDYYFAKINDTTDKMTEIFKKEYQRYGKSVEVIDIGHASKCFKEEVTNFISKSISSVEWTVKRGKKEKGNKIRSKYCRLELI